MRFVDWENHLQTSSWSLNVTIFGISIGLRLERWIFPSKANVVVKSFGLHQTHFSSFYYISCFRFCMYRMRYIHASMMGTFWWIADQPTNFNGHIIKGKPPIKTDFWREWNLHIGQIYVKTQNLVFTQKIHQEPFSAKSSWSDRLSLFIYFTFVFFVCFFPQNH